MSEMISMPVNDIPEPERRSLENLLGQRLEADQQVCVMVFSAAAVYGRVDILCTRDRHLRRAEVISSCRQFSIRVLTDLELLAELRAGE